MKNKLTPQTISLYELIKLNESTHSHSFKLDTNAMKRKSDTQNPIKRERKKREKEMQTKRTEEREKEQNLERKMKNEKKKSERKFHGQSVIEISHMFVRNNQQCFFCSFKF